MHRRSLLGVGPERYTGTLSAQRIPGGIGGAGTGCRPSLLTSPPPVQPHDCRTMTPPQRPLLYAGRLLCPVTPHARGDLVSLTPTPVPPPPPLTLLRALRLVCGPGSDMPRASRLNVLTACRDRVRELYDSGDDVTSFAASVGRAGPGAPFAPRCSQRPGAPFAPRCSQRRGEHRPGGAGRGAHAEGGRCALPTRKPRRLLPALSKAIACRCVCPVCYAASSVAFYLLESSPVETQMTGRYNKFFSWIFYKSNWMGPRSG